MNTQLHCQEETEMVIHTLIQRAKEYHKALEQVKCDLANEKASCIIIYPYCWKLETFELLVMLVADWFDVIYCHKRFCPILLHVHA